MPVFLLFGYVRGTILYFEFIHKLLGLQKYDSTLKPALFVQKSFRRLKRRPTNAILLLRTSRQHILGDYLLILAANRGIAPSSQVEGLRISLQGASSRLHLLESRPVLARTFVAKINPLPFEFLSKLINESTTISPK